MTSTIIEQSDDLEVVDHDHDPVVAPASPPEDDRSPGKHRLAIAIAISGVVAGVIVFILWFHTGAFYARGDLAPFVRTSLRSEFGWQWTHQNTGAGGPTYELVRGVELVFVGIAHALGGGDAMGERLLFAAIFAFTASGVAAFTARFVTRPWLVALAGILGAFGPVTMVNLPNVLVPLVIGCIAWSGALAIDAASTERPARPRLLAALSLAFAYVALNPPLLVVLAFWLVLLPITAAMLTGTGTRGVRRTLVFLGRCALWAVPLALWWLVPYVSALHSASDSGLINANTDVFSWSWTHAHGSLDRVLALVAKWSWPDPKFGNNASVMARPVFLGLAFALPIGLLAAPLVVRPARRRIALFVVAAALALAFVAKGFNAPLRSLNAFMYEHVPGMFLLREPVSKLGVLLALAVLLGWVFTVDALASRTSRRRWRAAMIALVVLPIAFAAPMLTGAVIQNSDRVRVPAAWSQVGRVIDGSQVPGKALVLPLDDFYQVPTTWGFYGADTLPVQVMHRPTITRNPQRYIGDSDNFEQLLETVQSALVGGAPDTVPGALRALGVSHIVVRKDIDYSSPIRTVQMARPEPLIAALESVPHIRAIATTSVADVYEFNAGAEPVTALSGTIAAPGAQGEALASLAATAPAGTAMSTTGVNDAPLVRGQAWYVDVNDPGTVAPTGTGDWTYRWHATSAPLVTVASTAHGLELRPAATVQLAGRSLPGRIAVAVPTRSPATAALVGSQLVDLTPGRGYARITPGITVQPYAAGRPIPLESWSAVGDCNRYDAQTPALHSSFSDGTIRLRTDLHSACVSAPIAGVNDGDIVRLRLEQRAVTGAAPRTCLWQQGTQTCASLAWSAKRDGEWYALSAIYRVPPGAGRVAIYLYADEPAPGTTAATEAWYRSVSFSRLNAGSAQRVEMRGAPTGTVHLAGGRVSVATKFDAPQPVVGARGGAGDCANSGQRSVDRLGIRAEPFRPDDATSVRLSASRDSGCVAMPVLGLQREVTYQLSFDARVERGSAPRVCLWEESAEKCAPFDPVQMPTGASGTYAYRGRVDSDAASSRLFLYADANEGATTIDYAAVRLRPVSDDALVLTPAHVQTPPVPSITWRSDGPARYRVQVQRASGPFLLTLADAFSNDWHVRGLPAGAHAQQVEIDGYRNGWTISGATGAMALTVEYAPARYGRDALRVSQLTALAFALSFVVGWALKRRRKRGAARNASSDEAADILRRLQLALEAAEQGPRRVPLADAGFDFGP